MPLRAAFAYSINTVAVRLAQDVGTRSVADMAQRFGITSRVNTNPSMALASSEVRLIDMTRAYAAVGRSGIAVTPFGIRRVTTADGTLLYQHEDDETRVLVQPWVAAQMTDLLEGRGRARHRPGGRLGRPTAGKTGTTTSNKDGWFVGFSSGITTGVWMGRDDNRALPGLAGGRAPARAFHDFMARAVANRPVEPFVTEAAPDWQIEQDEEFWYTPPADDPLVDADGNPLETQPRDEFPVEVEPAPGPGPGPVPEEPKSQERLDRNGSSARSSGRARRAGRRRRAAATRTSAKLYLSVFASFLPRFLFRPGDGGLTSGLAADAVERAAFAAQPEAGALRILAEQALDEGVEIGTVVEVDEVRHLVRDGRRRT